jgi:hypothetical protein
MRWVTALSNNIKRGIRSWLEMQPSSLLIIKIQETMDFELNAIRNRIWYRGDSNELEQLYNSVNEYADRYKFWTSRCTPGMEMRKIHIGLPGLIVPIISGIVLSDMNDFDFADPAQEELWKEIEKGNKFRKALERSLKEGVNVGGVVGSFEGYVPTANDLYLRGKSNISSWVYLQSADFHFETGMIYAYNPGSGSPTIGASINLTGYNYLNAEVMCTSSGNLSLRINKSDLYSSNITSTSLTLNANTVTTISLNISAISATRVFGLGISNNRHYYIYRIWLS